MPLQPKKGKWVDELPKVIWSHNTSESRTTKFTPFKLLYDVEAINPEELKHQSLRATSAGEQHQPSDELDLIELDILQAASNLNKYQNETRKWRDKKVVKKRHLHQRLGLEKEAKCRKSRKNAIKVGWPLARNL
jgi:hypothetical protein